MELVNLLDLQLLGNSANSDDDSLDESDLRGMHSSFMIRSICVSFLCTMFFDPDVNCLIGK